MKGMGMQTSTSPRKGSAERAQHPSKHRSNQVAFYFLSRNLDDNSKYEALAISFPNEKTNWEASCSRIVKITLREEFMKMNQILGQLPCPLGCRPGYWTRASWIAYRAPGLGILSHGMPPDDCAAHEVYTNQTNVFEGSIAVVNHKDKDQAAGLEITESFILCSYQASQTQDTYKEYSCLCP
jgi:hypothetical protein